MIDNTLTYISLFSSAGIGCYGFKQNGFECIATNELIKRRLEIQKLNNKCKFNSGYITGDIKNQDVKNKINEEIIRWKKMGNDGVDVLVATPPCQGISVANHKKNNNDLQRNSLVVESINLIKTIKPKIFILENVMSFWKTSCVIDDCKLTTIGEAVENKLSSEYLISKRVINFKNYGSNSSRTRTLVIGVRNDLTNFVVPLELFPDYCKEKTLYEVIGKMRSLKWGEYDPNDFFHSFREYDPKMKDWIADLKEGESAFNNKELKKIPHKVVNGKIVLNQSKNADKYTRQKYSDVAPCVHTRNDQLASQNTIHPIDDRVFSIRELMKMMTIPNHFKWTEESLNKLNALSLSDKKSLSKKIEINIRQCIGEAVPTKIFAQIANKIKKCFLTKHLKDTEIKKIIQELNLINKNNLIDFLVKKYNYYSEATISRIVEISNAKQQNNAAFYTNRFIVNYIVENLPEFEQDEITIVEPSVGAGNFLTLLYKKYENKKRVNLILVDVDEQILSVLKKINNAPHNFNVVYIVGDFLDVDFQNKKIDLVVGNPPFLKMKSVYQKKHLNNNINKQTKNLAEYFLEKSLKIAKYVSLILPKNILNTPEFSETRKLLKRFSIDCILDFGELGFNGILIETINLMINSAAQFKNKTIVVKSIPTHKTYIQERSYITDDRLPYWVIYRDNFFDKIFDQMEFDIFLVFRDRQITTKKVISQKEKDKKYVRVLKSRNINNNGSKIININGYDSYIALDELCKLKTSCYLNRSDVYMVPNMTYKPRIMKKEKGYVTNGSLALLIPKENEGLTDEQQKYFASDEYRKFYNIARNYQTRSLNIDELSVFWFGRKK